MDRLGTVFANQAPKLRFQRISHGIGAEKHPGDGNYDQQQGPQGEHRIVVGESRPEARAAMLQPILSGLLHKDSKILTAIPHA
jgi:hypothetical protein